MDRSGSCSLQEVDNLAGVAKNSGLTVHGRLCLD